MPLATTSPDAKWKKQKQKQKNPLAQLFYRGSGKEGFV